MKKLTFLCFVLYQIGSAQIQNSSGNRIFFTDRAKQVRVESKAEKKSSKFELSTAFQISGIGIPRWKSIRYYKVESFEYTDRGEVEDNTEFVNSNKGLKAQMNEEKDTITINGIKYKVHRDSLSIRRLDYRVPTVSTSPGITTSFGIESNDRVFNTNNNSKYSFSVGFIKGIDKIDRYQLRKTAYSIGLSARYTYENRAIFYDTIALMKNVVYPGTFSIDFHSELYPKFFPRGMAIGLTLGYRYDSNTSTLDSFQDLPISFQDTNISSLDDEAGKIGNFEYLNNYYWSISVPWFIFKQVGKESGLFRQFIGKTGVVPFVRHTFGDNSVVNPGIALTIVNRSFNADKFQELFDTSFVFGIDWLHQNGNWSKPIIYFGGTFATNKIFDHKEKNSDKVKGSL